MEFCDECGSLLPPGDEEGLCTNCGTSLEERTGRASAENTEGESGGEHQRANKTRLEELQTTQSGTVKKSDAMEWLEDLERPSSAELKRGIVEKPNDFSGSTFPADISTIRLTGDPQFIETVAGLFSWIVDMEDYSRRVEINLQQVEDRDTGETTGNYALYLSVAERS
jgi:DNA-directed RNA polymerase subunit M/transcription elongation factor TFIIS